MCGKQPEVLTPVSRQKAWLYNTSCSVESVARRVVWGRMSRHSRGTHDVFAEVVQVTRDTFVVWDMERTHDLQYTCEWGLRM